MKKIKIKITRRPRVKIYWADEQNKYDAGRRMKALIEKAVRGTLECENFDRDVIVSVTFTDNEGIREKNREFRDIDRATDVLSFPMYDMANGDMPEEGMDCELGDIVLSLERAAEQAVEFGHSYERECAFLTVHSMLHLLGYDHVNSEEEDEEMRAHQRVIMTHIGLER
ncbi:MAG: rRNA maturation RNase YbeY [Clostridia bacterium]|nr:rRNA maturation RNase YbeY [Clostridia bacterium]MBO5258544.1 rRNA maturation RNase YbeY [Clostridia bacterium]